MGFVVPKVIGHRGAKAYAPENTLASIHAAADRGVEWVEVDVKLSKDDVALVFHDEEVDRCTNASGPFKDMDLARLRELDAGSWYGKDFTGERIPTLEELLRTVLHRGLCINLEIKPSPGREVQTAEVMLDVASRIWPKDRPPPLISSFQEQSLGTAVTIMPEWPRSFLIDKYRPDWKDRAQSVQASTVNINGNRSTRDQIREYVEFAKPVLAYTINQPNKARELMGLGVHGFFADNPDVILQAVKSAG